MKTRINVAITFLLICIPVKSLFAQIQWDTGMNTQNTAAFQEMEEAIHNGDYGEIRSIIVIRNKQNIYEQYFNGWQRDSLQQLQSATKSIVSTLLGVAIQQNYVENTQELISNYYKEEFQNITDPLKQKITIEDLLTQQHGLDWKEAPWNSPDNNWRNILESEGNWYRMILDTPMDAMPGTDFNYSNAAPVLITGLIQHASDMQIDKFAQKYLFDPLSINEVKYWDGNGGPHNNGLALLYLKTRDMAKIGQLYLQKGTWNDRQILPTTYVEEAVSAKLKNVEGNPFYKSYDYGHFWWVNPVLRDTQNKSSNMQNPYIYLARGAGGQNIIVWPDEELVFVVTAWNLQQTNITQKIFNDFIVPYVKN